MNPLRLVLLAALLLFMLIILLVGLHWGDEAPPGDADLLPPAPGEFAADGYPLLLAAVDAYERLSDPMRATDLRPDGSDDEWLRGELEKNETALRLLAEAVEQPALLLPALHPFDTREGLGEIREMTRLVTARGRLALRDPAAEPQEFDDFLLALRLGRLMAEGGSSLLDLLVGIAVQGIALDALTREALHLRLGPEETRSLLGALSGEQLSRQSLDTNVRGEYVHTRTMLDITFGAGGHGGGAWYENLGYVIKPNKTLRLIGEEYRAVLPLIGEPVYPQEGWPDDDFTLRGGFPLENSVGRMLAQISLPSLTNVIRSGFLHEANSGCRRLIVALTAFEKAEGRLPHSLEELTGVWIDELPMDPFSGEPLRYSPAHRMVFTVGPELNFDADTVATSGRDLRGFLVPEGP